MQQAVNSIINNGTINVHHSSTPPPEPGPKRWLKLLLWLAGIVLTVLLEHAVGVWLR